MIDDPEIIALNTAYTALKELDAEAMARNLNWLATKLGISLSTKPTSIAHLPLPTSASPAKNLLDAPDKPTEPSDFGSFATSAEFLSKIHELSAEERVLAVAAYLQNKDPENELTGFSINKELKHIGHGVKNITRPVESLVKSTPQLMIQLRKSGKTRQAKKTYRVTEEGVKAVKLRLANPAAQA